MTDKLKKIIKWVSVGFIVLGSVGLYFGGGTEGYAIEIVSGVFVAIAFIVSKIKE